MALTEKQEQFCRNIISGMSGKDSYISAYNAKCKDQVAYNEASKLLMRDDIQAKLAIMRKPLEAKAISEALMNREEKKRLIMERIEHCKTKDDDVAIARYLDMLNKMDSEYINITKHIDDTATPLTELNMDDLKRLAN